MPASSPSPIFVIGCPRSGTTLLRVMLNAHPSIAIPPENRFVIPLYRKRHKMGKPGSKRAARKMARTIGRRGRGLAKLGLTFDQLKAGLVARRPRDVAQAMDYAFSTFAEQRGATRWGDKRPSYFAFVDELAEMFPKAQFVYIVRDGRACAASLKRPPFSHSSATAMAVWLNSVHACQRSGQRLGPDRFIKLRYEDLVADTESTLRTLCTFLGEPFDPAMLNPEAVVRDHVPSQFQQHAQIAAGVNTGSVEAWKRELSKAEVASFELLSGRALRRDGYEPVRTGRPSVSLAAEIAYHHWRFRLSLPLTRFLDRRRAAMSPMGAVARWAWRRLPLQQGLFPHRPGPLAVRSDVTGQ